MKITANWIVGFVDGDGHFGYIKTSDNTDRFYFVVSQDKRSINVLYALKAFFKCGSVHKAGQNMYEYKVSAKKHLLEIIIPFFKNNPLQSSKQKDFELFCIYLWKSQQDSEVLNFNQWKKELQSLKFQKTNDSNVCLNRDWLLGFIDAEGCFVCSLVKNQFISQLIIGLSSIDTALLDEIKKFLGCGIRYSRKNGVEIFQLSSQKDKLLFVNNFLFTKGGKDNLRTEKRIKARKWGKMILFLETGQHKTKEGWDKLYLKYTRFKKNEY